MKILKILFSIFLLYFDYKLRKFDDIKDKKREKEKEKQENKNQNLYYSKDLNGKLLFLRHGRTDFNSDTNYISHRINQKYAGCRLAEVGILQAKSKQKLLNTLSLEKVYVSPFYRTLQALTYSLENHPNKNNIIALVQIFFLAIKEYIFCFLFRIKIR